MLNITRAEIYKLFKSKYFMICEIVMAALIIGTYFILVFIEGSSLGNMSVETGNLSAGIATQEGLSDLLGPVLTGTTGFMKEMFSGDSIIVFISIMMCLLVTTEFRMGTIKNIIPVNGRAKIYFAKLLASLVMSFVFMCTTLATCLLVGIIGIGDLGGITTNIAFYIQFLLVQTLLCFSVGSMYIMLSFVLRNIAAAMPICIFSHYIILAVLYILGFFHKSFAVASSYLPSQLMKVYLTPEGFSQTNALSAIVMCTAFIVITTLVGIFGFRKADL